MSEANLKNAVDTYTNEVAAKQSKKYNDTRRLLVSDQASNRKYIWIYFSNPIPKNANVSKALLRIRNMGAISGSADLNVRLADKKWKSSEFSWEEQTDDNVGTVGSTVTKTKVDANANSEWEIDVKSLYQLVANGTHKWFGFRITTNGAVNRAFHSSKAAEEYRPTVELEWSEDPDQPEELKPRDDHAVSVSHPFLRFVYSDSKGETALGALKVQISTTNNFTTPEFDSGWVLSDDPELDLSRGDMPGGVYGGVPLAATRWWRVMARDASGDESEWSEPVKFRRIAKGALTIDNPPDSPGYIGSPSVVTDTTFPVAWTFANQTKRRVIIRDISKAFEVVYDSKWKTTTATSLTVPKKVLKRSGHLYHLELRTMDNEVRENITNEKPYSVAYTVFKVEYSDVVAKVTSLAATINPVCDSWVDLTFNRTEMPDGLKVLMDDEVILDDLDPDDYFVSGTSYKITVRVVDPRVEHTFQVLASVNGESSNKGAGVKITTFPLTTVLGDEDRYIRVWNPVGDDSSSRETELHFVQGGPPVLITQNDGVTMGTVSGLITGYMGDDADEMAQAVRWWEKRLGVSTFLTPHDNERAMEVVPYDWNMRASNRHDGTRDYLVSFSWYEV